MQDVSPANCASLMIGTTVSHYRILEQLGQGGMGVVYKAEDTRLDRLVALKFLPPQMSGNEDAKRRFVQEAKAASALDHANICAIHDIGEVPSESGAPRVFIVMAFYDGATLKYRLQDGPLPIEECIQIGEQLAAGLQRAHEAGIVHRDVKPANIMVTDRGEVKILDFGVAKLVGGLELTQTGSTLGTAGYMSPEQARADDVDFRTDLWSLGVVVYEMLTGVRPFRGDYDAAVAYAILNEEPQPVEELRAEAPAVLSELVQQLLAKIPDDRPAGAGDVAARLGALARADTAVAQADTTASTSTKSEAAVAGERSARSKSSLALGGVAVLVVAAVLLFLAWPAAKRDRAGPSSENPRKIAVLPFADLSPDGGGEAIGDGITEELIYGLGKVTGLQVTARSSSFYFKGRNEEISTIADRLNVDLVLEGSVRSEGNALRVSTQLINAADGFQLWSERYDRQMNDVLAVQDDIMRSIVSALRIQLTGEQSSRVTEQGTDDPEAYQLYLRGRQEWTTRTEEGLLSARERFKRAIEIDPGFARAYVGLADVYIIGANWGYLPYESAFDSARVALQQAIRIDDEVPEAYASLGGMVGQIEMEWETAESHFKRAVELDPSYATAYQWYAEMLVQLLRCDDAVTNMSRALELDPLSPIINANLMTTYLCSGDLDRAEAASLRAVELFPDFGLNHIYLSMLYVSKGDLERGREEAGKCIEVFPDCVAITGMIDAVEGNPGEARRRLKQLDESDARSSLPLLRGVVLMGLGEHEAAIESIEEAIPYASAISLIRTPFYRPLMDHPRFEGLLKKLNLQ